MLQSIGAAVETEADRLSSALSPLQARDQRREVREPQGGPFVPAARLHFVERAAMLERALQDVAVLRRHAELLPLRPPTSARRVSSGFGLRDDPFLNRPALHGGIDFVAPEGTAVRATAPGTVVAAGWNGGYGQMVEIRHADGITTRYAHLSAVLVPQGARVAAGNLIGRVGSTGRSTGPHLHYETRRGGEPVDPARFLAAGRILWGAAAPIATQR